ncbi:hypothetical protein R9X47_00295 [Wukongibacter baidiensis]|uniref:hypothetical protein n=1 Tax=Wukongibacter baidiensis TaxID=1723361 RepID=UPI003D7FD219
MKLFIERFTEDFFQDTLLEETDSVPIKFCLQYTSYGFFIGAIISLFQGDIDHVIVSLLIAIFLKI